MILENWVADAEALAQQIPQGELRTRLDFLLSDVAGRAEDGNVFSDSIDYPMELEETEDAFLVLEGDEEMLPPGGPQSFVSRTLDFDILVLPPYNKDTPLLNAHTLGHELTHITERDGWDPVFDPLPTTQEIRGHSEREAFGLNVALLSCIDGTDFARYRDRGVSAMRMIPEGQAYGLIHGIDTPQVEPPKDTYMHDLWAESSQSRAFLQVVMGVAILEERVEGFSSRVTNRLFADMFYSRT
jgi:hypothetical protein